MSYGEASKAPNWIELLLSAGGGPEKHQKKFNFRIFSLGEEKKIKL